MINVLPDSSILLFKHLLVNILPELSILNLFFGIEGDSVGSLIRDDPDAVQSIIDPLGDVGAVDDHESF